MGNVVELPSVTIARLEAERDELADALASLCDELDRTKDAAPGTASPAVARARAAARVALSRVLR